MEPHVTSRDVPARENNSCHITYTIFKLDVFRSGVKDLHNVFIEVLVFILFGYIDDRFQTGQYICV